MVTVTAEDAAEKAQKVKTGELPGPAKSLTEAVCRVMEQVSYVQKDKQMTGGGSYRYVSVEAVIDKLRPEMIRQQLAMFPVSVQPLTVESFEGRNGGRQNRTQVIYTFELRHAGSGESQVITTIGEAIDVGDKSSNKCMTAARKYALILAFNIETGNDPDDTPSHEQERAAPPQQRTKPLAQHASDHLGRQQRPPGVPEQQQRATADKFVDQLSHMTTYSGCMGIVPEIGAARKRGDLTGPYLAGVRRAMVRRRFETAGSAAEIDATAADFSDVCKVAPADGGLVYAECGDVTRAGADAKARLKAGK